MSVTLTQEQVLLLRQLLPKHVIQERADLMASEGQRRWEQGAKSSADACYASARGYNSLRDAIYPPTTRKS